MMNMRIFDPHVHMYSRTMDDYDRMSLSGVEVIVEPSFWLGSTRRSPHTFFDYFQHILEFEPERARKFGISHYSCIAMNPKEANNLDLAMEVIEGLEPYLDHPRCLALGEIGFDKNTDAEEEVMRRQLRIAKEKGILVMVHTPHTEKAEGTERTIRVLREEQMDPERVLIDHNTEETIEITLKYGAWAGMTIYPGKVTPERAIAILQEYGTDRMMINSAADWGPSDSLSIPRTCRNMKEADFSIEKIRKVVWENPYAYYSLSGKLANDPTK
jgi:predicted metal-dependent TIM-barrel fold hydrolase